VVSAGIYAFAFFFSLSQAHSDENAVLRGSLRGAIAAGVVVEYLVLVGIVAFFNRGPERLPPITESLISSFTTIVGIVIAFYFGRVRLCTSTHGHAKKSLGPRPRIDAGDEARHFERSF